MYRFSGSVDIVNGEGGRKGARGMDHGVSPRAVEHEGKACAHTNIAELLESFQNWLANTQEGHRGAVFAILFLIVTSCLILYDGLMHDAGTG